MAGNPIASLFAQLGFRYDRSKLQAFQKDLQTTARQIDSKQGLAGSYAKANKTQQQYFKDLTRGFQQAKPNIVQARRQLARIREAFKENKISHQQYVDGRRRGLMTINKLEQEQHTRRMRRARQLERMRARANQPFAGGQDPRQAGNHRLISAIHSDVGLGMMVGGFAIAQSSMAYQEMVGLKQGLNAAMGDIQKGGKELEWLIKTSNRLGISLTAASEGYKTFAAATRGTELAGKETRRTFEAVSSYAKVLNLSADDTKGVFRALTQMVSKGRVQAEELRGQFGERLPGAYQAAARAMGKTTEELAKMSENGELLAEDLLPPLATELMKMANSGNQLEKAMNNTNSALNRFSNNLLLANMRFQEAGMDKGIRDLANSASDFLMRADELWTLMGKIGPVLFYPFRALFELFGALSDKFGEFADKVQMNEKTIRWLGVVMMALFGWSRKLLFTFLIIPAALSNIAAIIDGEQLTWSQWLVTLLGVLGALTGIAKIASKAKSALGGGKVPLKAGIAGGLMGGLLSAGTMKVSVVSFLGLSAFGAMAAMLYDAFFGAGPSARTGAQFGDKFGDNLALPENTGGGIPAMVNKFLHTKPSELDFQLPKMPDYGSDFNYMLNRSAESQAITSGDITFNITGDNSKEIADEVLRVIHSDVIRPTALNDQSQEK